VAKSPQSTAYSMSDSTRSMAVSVVVAGQKQSGAPSAGGLRNAPRASTEHAGLRSVDREEKTVKS